MSTNWRYEGQSTDPSVDIDDLVQTLITNNWTQTNPPLNNGSNGGVRMVSGNYDGYGDYAVSTQLLTQTSPEFDTLGASSAVYTFWVGLDVYARTATANTKPAQLGNMIRQIEKILALNTTSLASGIRFVGIPEWNQAIATADADGTKSLWYVHGRVLVNFRMAKS